MEVFQWLRDNAFLVSIAVNIGLLIIWTFYAILFYQQYARQRRPMLIVHLSNWFAKEAECLIVNLTREPVHILGVLFWSDGDSQSLKLFTNGEDLLSEMQDGRGVESVIKQGPLSPASTMELGPLFELVEKAMPEFLEAGSRESRVLEIRVAAIGPDGRLFGARRDFHVESTEDGFSVHPESLHTKQMTSRRARREITCWLEGASQNSAALLYPRIKRKEEAAQQPH